MNADTIATGLSAFRPEVAAIAAGRVMLQRLDALAAARRDFAFESTLAARSFAPWIRVQRSLGYRVRVVFLALPDPEAAVVRVADRVRRGGHDIPPEVIRRRYASGLRNFHDLYRPLASSWQVYDNGREDGPLLVAEQIQGGPVVILDPVVWSGLEAKR